MNLIEVDVYKYLVHSDGIDRYCADCVRLSCVPRVGDIIRAKPFNYTVKTIHLIDGGEVQVDVE